MKTLSRALFKLLVAVIALTATDANAIVDIPLLKPGQTPVLSAAMPAQREAFCKRYQTNDVDSFYLKFVNEADVVLNELKLVLTSHLGRGQLDKKVLEEFDRVKAEIVSRGYEPSEEGHFAPQNELVIYYDGRPGPTEEKGDGAAFYLHRMKFELWNNFQLKGQTLDQHAVYPRAVLSGLVFISCAKSFDQCHLVNATFEQAGIQWEQMPGFRGGNSSAGGRSGK